MKSFSRRGLFRFLPIAPLATLPVTAPAAEPEFPFTFSAERNYLTSNYILKNVQLVSHDRSSTDYLFMFEKGCSSSFSFGVPGIQGVTAGVMLWGWNNDIKSVPGLHSYELRHFRIDPPPAELPFVLDLLQPG